MIKKIRNILANMLVFLPGMRIAIRDGYIRRAVIWGDLYDWDKAATDLSDAFSSEYPRLAKLVSKIHVY